MREYQLRMEAIGVKRAYEHQMIALQAWENQRVQATTGSGKNIKSKWTSFQHFFDIEKELAAVTGEPTKEDSEATERLKRLNEFKALKAAGKIVPWSQRNKRRKEDEQ